MSLRAILNDPEPAPVSVPAPARNVEPPFSDAYPSNGRSRSPSAARDDLPQSEPQYIGKDRNSYERVRQEYAQNTNEFDYPKAYQNTHGSGSRRHSGSSSAHRSPIEPRGPPTDEPPPPHAPLPPLQHKRGDRERAYEPEDRDAYAQRPHSRTAHAAIYSPAPAAAAEWQNGNGNARGEYEGSGAPVSGRMHRPRATSLEAREEAPEEYPRAKKRSYFTEQPPNEYGREEPHQVCRAHLMEIPTLNAEFSRHTTHARSLLQYLLLPSMNTSTPTNTWNRLT